MKNKVTLICIFFLLIFAGCNFPTSLPISEKQKGADDFARHFIANVLNGQIDSCYADLSADKQSIHMRYFLVNANRNIGMVGRKVTGYKVVEANSTYGLTDKDIKSIANHTLAYEIEFDKANVLFLMNIYEKDGQFKVTSVDGQILKAPLVELTKFTLARKTFIHYIFLAFTILIPLFIFISVGVLLFTKTTIKKKIIWSLVIFFINLPQLSIIWNTGIVSLQLITLSFLGSGFIRTSLYIGWILHFNIPIGAIAFWLRRKKLVANIVVPIIKPTIPFDSDEIKSTSEETKIDDYTRYMPK
jgi:hypothetical protein